MRLGESTTIFSASESNLAKGWFWIIIEGYFAGQQKDISNGI